MCGGCQEERILNQHGACVNCMTWYCPCCERKYEAIKKAEAMKRNHRWNHEWKAVAWMAKLCERSSLRPYQVVALFHRPTRRDGFKIDA